MAQVISQFNEYVGISNDTWTDGLHAMITAAIPEFNPLEKRKLGEMRIYKACTEDCIGNTGGCANVKRVKTVVCTYFGNSANHLIPCIHRGERVRVFNYAGTEQYYWREWGKDAGLRKCERIRWFAMDKKRKGKHWSTDTYLGPLPPQVDEYNDDGGDTPTEEYTYCNATDKNTYFVEINTNPGDKGFRIHTCKEDGEPFIYDISIWPEKGILEISDNGSGGGCKNGLGNCPCHMDTGNNIRLNSFEHWWHIRNVDDSCIDICKENIFMKCKNTISMIAGKDIVESAGIRYTRTAPVQNIVGNQRTTTLSTIDTVHAPAQVFNGQSQVCNFGITKGVFKHIDLTGDTYKLYAKTMNLGGDTFFCTAKYTFIVQAGIAVTVTTKFYELEAWSVYWDICYFYFCVSSFSMSCGGGSYAQSFSAHGKPLTAEEELAKSTVNMNNGDKVAFAAFYSKFIRHYHGRTLPERGVMEIEAEKRMTFCIPYLRHFTTKYNLTGTNVNLSSSYEQHDMDTFTVNADTSVTVKTDTETHNDAIYILNGSKSVTVNTPLETHNVSNKYILTATNAVDVTTKDETHTVTNNETHNVSNNETHNVSNKYILNATTAIEFNTKDESHTIGNKFLIDAKTEVYVTVPLENHNITNKFILSATNEIYEKTISETHDVSNGFLLNATKTVQVNTTDETHTDSNSYVLNATNSVYVKTTNETHDDSDTLLINATKNIKANTTDETHSVSNKHILNATEESYVKTKMETHDVGDTFQLNADKKVNVNTTDETHHDTATHILKADTSVYVETPDETHKVSNMHTLDVGKKIYAKTTDETHDVSNMHLINATKQAHVATERETHVVGDEFNLNATKKVYVKTKDEVHELETFSQDASDKMVFKAPTIEVNGTTKIDVDTPLMDADLTTLDLDTTTQTNDFQTLTMTGTSSMGVTVPTETHKNTTKLGIEAKLEEHDDTTLNVKVSGTETHTGGTFNVSNSHGHVPVVIQYGSSSW